MQNTTSDQAPDWELVASSEKFKNSPPEVKEAVRERFYQKHVAPSVPDDMADAVWGRFVERTSADIGQPSMGLAMPQQMTAQGAQPDQPGSEGGIITDTGNLLAGGVNRAAQNVRELVGRIPVVGEGILNAGDAVDNFIHGKDSETLLRENEKKYQGNLTQETQDAQAKLWWDSETKSLGPAWSDPRAYYSGIVQSLPEMVLTMGPSGRMAKAYYAKTLAKTGSKALAAKSAAKAAFITGGVGEGLLGGADTARQIREEILDMPQETLAGSDAYQSLLDEGMTDTQARTALAEDSATQGMLIAGVATGVFGGLGDRMFAKMLTSNMKKGVASRIIKGAIGEGLFEEVPQSASQRLAENLMIQKADPDRELADGVVNESLGGLATGGVMGGGIGAMSRSRVDYADDPAAPEMQDAEADATFEGTPEQARLEGPGLQGLPEPDQVFYGDSQGTMQDIGPVRNVDGVMQPTPQSQQWVNPDNRADAPASLIGGEGMEAQTPRGAPPGLEGQFIPGQGQQTMTPPADMGLTLDGNIERLRLPEPEAFVVDSEGNTQRGATAPQVFNEPPMTGGAGMDRQAPTAPPRQQKAAPKAMPAEKSPQERAQYSWNSMSTFERNKAAQDTLGYADADMTEAAAKAWDQLVPQDQQKLADAMTQDSSQRWDAPNQKISDKDRPVLQNRDRSTDALITQMQGIRSKPDYNRLSISRDFGNGAPVVEPGAEFPAAQLGRTEQTSTSTGRPIEVQYAVMEADQLLPSNDALGNPVKEYQSGVAGKSRAIAGNGRVAGITEAWKAGNASTYKDQMVKDTLHGIDPDVIRTMKQPVLVRIMPLSEVSSNIGDESNVSGQAGLSPTEQANTDMRRIDLAELRLTEDNELSEDTVLDFIKGMPKSEMGTLLSKSGRPTPAAYARAEAALFQQAYQNEALTENLVDLKGDAKFIMNALMRAAPAMAKLEGAGIYDIRPLVSEAAEVAVNARRQGIKLSEFIKMGDFGRNPQVMPILEMMIESGQRTTAIGDKLINLAKMAYAEANKAGQDMFGEVDKQSPKALMKKAFDGEQANAQEIDGAPEALGDDGRTGPDASNAEGRAADGKGKSDSGAVQADQPAKPETAEARLKKKAAEKKASTEPTTEKWRKNYLLAKKRATELGIDPKEHGKLPGLVKAIDAATAETAKPETLDLTQQTEETLAAEAERLEQLQKEEAAQKAKQKAAESKARERDADKARADEVIDDFQLGQQAEDAMSGMGDIFDAQQSEVKPSKRDAEPETGTEQDTHIPVGDWRSQIGGNNFRNNKDGITVRKDDRVIHIRGANSIAASKKALDLATQDIRELHHAAAKENPSDPFSEATIWLDGNGDMIRKRGTKKPTGALSRSLKQAETKTSDTKEQVEPSQTVDPKSDTKQKAKAAKPRHEGPAIEDFGEKIGGARKDVWDGFKDDLNKVSDEQIASQPLSKIWPEPNYKEMIESGEPPKTVALIRALREEITSKPRVKYKLARWAESVIEARSTANALIDGTLPADQFLSELSKSGRTLEGFAGRVELYELVGHEKSLAKIYFAKHHYSLYRGEKDVTLWVVENNNTSGTFGGWPSQVATGKTKEQAIEAFKKAYDDMPEKGAKKTKQSFDIWSERGREGYLVGKKIGRHYAEFAGPFKTTKEAREYVINSEAELTDKLARYREIPAERRDTERPRVGEDHRKGQDVTPELFAEEFGFRGVEFGNWVEQGRRQADLNHAYDALMDMAAVLDVPAKAISLNGALSLAFGARGKGGKNAAKAHYEPGKVVINLSKRTGAGSLGHEWWHALDNYFSRERDSRTNYMTTERDVNLSSRSSNYHYADKRVRKEMVDAFGEVVKRINETALEARSRILDNKRTKEYWTTTEEMSARAFESYLISKLQDKNAHNDYLANIVDESTWAAAEALGFEMDGSYPYPTAGEVPAIRAGFDHFFNTIESRETDSGVQLYKTNKKDGATGVRAEAITDAIASTPELAGVKVVQSFEDLPADARKQVEDDGYAPEDVGGLYSNGSSYVVADNVATIEDAVRTATHEEVGHKGIRGLLGDKLTPTMERIYSSMAATAAGRKLIKDIRADYSHLRDKDQRQAVAEELVAHLIETGDKPNLVQRFVSKVRELLRAMFPQVKWTNLDVLALGEQSRNWLRSGAQRTEGGKSSALYSIKGKKNKHTSESFSDLTDKQKAALNKIAPLTTQQKAAEWFRDKTDRALLKIRQGLVDRFAALRELDEAAHGEDILNTDITNSSWVLARMSSAASGALHAMLNNGRIYLDQKQKVIDIQEGDSLGLGATLARLGSPAEIERFMGWIAGNRSARLAAEGRENLFSADDIDALKTLNEGKTESGKARKALYDDVFKEFQQYRDDVLAIAEQTGIITAENRALWRDEFYVPFYRVMDEEAKVGGPSGTKGLTRQEAYKKLKGGKQNLNDLLQNTMLNFNHLLTASLKNQAAAQALSNAEKVGVAEKTTEAARDKKASTFVLVDGQQQWYNIDDPLVFEALSMISDGGLNTSAVKVMSFFKRTFTNMTTITPQFIIANLLRDSMQATATSPVSKNFLKNIVTGGKDWTDSKKRARMMATGGAFSFGHIYNNDPHEMKAHLTRNLTSAQLLSSTKLIPTALRAGWDAWNAAANAAEDANRAAIFAQNEKSKGKLAAAFEARDLMDFSMNGAWPAVRFLIRVIPFLNARLQGLDKLYRSGVKPTLLTAFGKGNASDKQAAKRFLSVVGAISAASMALMLVNNDDEEYRKLEEWQKDTYWFVRLGDKAFFIPKPFEVGVIATMTERLLQQGIDDKATGELFKQRLGHALTQTFAFSVVPHAFQPILDVYSNVDAFTDRPIESMGMERLSKGLRSRANTTAPAHALSAVSRALGDEFPLAVSPVQADHLIAGYLGQVGAWGAGLVDTMWRTAKGETQPARHWHEYQPIRRFYKDLDTPNAYTRYSTLFYEGLRESGKVYADVMELQKLGKEDQMRETINKNRDMLGMRKNLNRAQRDLSKINARIGMIRIGGLDAEEKRREIDRLTVIKSRITEAAGKQVEAMKAAR